MSQGIDNIEAVAKWCERQIANGRPEAAKRQGHTCIKRFGDEAESVLAPIMERAVFEEDRILAEKIREQYGPK